MININYEELKKKINIKPSDLIKMQGFNNTLVLTWNMIRNDQWDETLQIYATKLLEELKNEYPDRWNANWRYEAFLGYAYDVILNFDKRYIAYKKAFDKANPVPPELLVALARCCWSPGKPPITEEEAILLVKQSINNIQYIESIGLLRGLYKSMENEKEEKYWNNILSKVSENGVHLPPLINISDLIQ